MGVKGGIGMGVLIGILAVVAFYLIYTLAAIIFSFLSSFPIIGVLLKLLASIRHEGLDALAVTIVALLSFWSIVYLIGLIGRSTKITGITFSVILGLLNVLLLVYNIVNKEWMFPNIVMIIGCIFVFYKFKND